MITEKEAKEIKKELEECQKPLYFFHDDPDGLASFLIMYRYKKEGKGIVVKASPKITIDYIKQVNQNESDKIFILDIALLDQEFVDNVNKKIIWIDHHEVQEIEGVKYYNPQKQGINIPASEIIYQALQTDLWLSAIGCISDWRLPKITKEFRKIYPDLLPETINTPEQALFETKAGKIAKIMSFNLKGKSKEIEESIKKFTEIKEPYEILEQKTDNGKYIYERFDSINKIYEKILNQAKNQATKEEILLFLYQEDKLSLTRDLANEMMYLFPEKTIILGREKNGEIKCSIRSKKKIDAVVAKSLLGIQGYGGGHENACGAVIKKEDFGRFIDNFKEELRKI